MLLEKLTFLLFDEIKRFVDFEFKKDFIQTTDSLNSSNSSPVSLGERLPRLSHSIELLKIVIKIPLVFYK